MPKESFTEKITFTDTEDKSVQIVVTARIDPNGDEKLSFAILREFIRNGEPGRTPWLTKRHVEATRRLLDRVETYLADKK